MEEPQAETRLQLGDLRADRRPGQANRFDRRGKALVLGHGEEGRDAVDATHNPDGALDEYLRSSCFLCPRRGTAAQAFGPHHLVYISAKHTNGRLGVFEAEVPQARGRRPTFTTARKSSSGSSKPASPSVAAASASSMARAP